MRSSKLSQPDWPGSTSTTLGSSLNSPTSAWREALPPRSGAARNLRVLAERGVLLGEPYTRQLNGKLRELRFHLVRDAVRITYWIASGRRIILLTVFRKQRMRETAEIERAVRAMERCIVEAHTVEEE
ncbi:type II toxin-antitoxin system RelE/ParE family toxin [Nocardia uniformis]|uniref:Type II toxin-antitoxin system RelE/ParE family toxin n=1 Tax=Nocardia uniformis TaxID=53432 RepID=A0A849C9K0_9NOCA|nr:type II toxin-antitoxin system RelE/ParE family toxin [Nocardia uniformis]